MIAWNLVTDAAATSSSDLRPPASLEAAQTLGKTHISLRPLQNLERRELLRLLLLIVNPAGLPAPSPPPPPASLHSTLSVVVIIVTTTHSNNHRHTQIKTQRSRAKAFLIITHKSKTKSLTPYPISKPKKNYTITLRSQNTLKQHNHSDLQL